MTPLSMINHDPDPQTTETARRVREQASRSQGGDPAVPVILRVSVESMRRELVHMVQAQMSGLNDLIEREVNKALSEFRFDDRFYNTVAETIDHTVRNKVSEVVRVAMDETFNNEAVRRKVAKLVVKRVTRPSWSLRPRKRAKRAK